MKRIPLILILIACTASSAIGQRQQFTEEVWPSLKETWGPGEYRAVQHQLALMLNKGLPHSTDEDFEPVFAQLINPENLASYDDKTIPLNDRFAKLFPSYAAYNAIAQMYVQSYARDESYNVESIKLSGFLLLMTRSQLALLDESIPTLDVEDPTYATRILGVAQTRLGVSRMMLGAVQILGERDRYPLEYRKSFAAIVANTWPAFVEKMDTDVRDALTRLLRKTAQSETDMMLSKELMKITNPKE